ncbi:L-aspartate oxidase [Alkalihalobacillus oceani]|uniref:L-aspartate oxidase n=1 Tax=Halalkalibacter oceani TaxID=1653776 RepID=A0A9X2DLX3_9BACI|nr:L-aspartate oxidase [Halalkalibacter oceani]MCM3712668.1 L-aspartate oxidase [Halalkalibacter oceani]
MADKAVDVVIIGSGIAGLMTAHLLADDLNVMIITKSNVAQSNSSLAQGGMAAAIDPLDSWSSHYADTLEAGHHHHHFDHLELLVKRAPLIVKKLEELGVEFDRDQYGRLKLGMEGAHSHRRIVHAEGDQTGRAITAALIRQVQHRVQLLEQTMVQNLLLTDAGVGGVETDRGVVRAKATILATGGAGQLFTHTSNVPEATGDGLALAYRAGARLIDMEFVQFHPTLLVRAGQTYGLISEAVRGEGAFLVNQNGERLMAWHPLKDLAPRDVVSRSIEQALHRGEQIFLDCRVIENFAQCFPGLIKRCQQAKIDQNQPLLPVAPGAHFMSGGIETNANGQTSLPGLYAIGEVACTGVHGANRLASNSLLEGLVFAEQVATYLREVPLFDGREAQLVEEGPPLVSGCPPTKTAIQANMTAYVGMNRDEYGLQEMKRWLEPYMMGALYPGGSTSREELERKNMVLVAWMITEAALLRKESRGGHYRSDYPAKDEEGWDGATVAISQTDGIIKQEKASGRIIPLRR